MNRRAESNQALAYAAARANGLGLPLLFYEGLTCSYPHANDRLHTFILEGVPDNSAALKKERIGYCFYPRKQRSDANDILYRLASKAALVITDDYPTFIAATNNRRVPGKIDCAYEAVDASCIVPMSRIEKREYAAYTIRPKIHKLLPHYLRPVELPVLKKRWKGPIPEFHVDLTREDIPALVAGCEIDHSIKPSTCFRGGSGAAHRRLAQFLTKSLARYDARRNEPSEHATSNLSPYLHFGHISSLEVALAAEDYAVSQHLSAASFLEELIVRRELAFNFARFTPKPDTLEALPDWAIKTLHKHASDTREQAYTSEQLERAETYDPLWNATQKELLLRGKIHGYYRMYWGKKIIEWSRTHEDALRFMIDMHDRYALDGRDPATYTNILWCFGLHDRPWTERPIFGQIRYMNFAGMKRKTDIQAYIEEIEAIERGGRDPLRMDEA